MAKLFESGFIDRFRDNRLFSGIADTIREISTLGLRYNDMLIKNSRAIGATEAQFMKQGIITDENLAYTLALSDTSSKKYIAYFDKDYASRRDFLRSFSLNGEIQFVVDTISDDGIVMDPTNQFCYPVLLNGEDIKEEVKKGYEEIFKKIYAYWQFNDDMQAHQLFRQFLIDGFLAFEIIYNDEGKKIVGFKELDPISLRPGVEKDPDGQLRKVWYQYEENLQMGRKLYDSQIIYISFAKGNIMSRVSYVETLVRSFNLLRIMEHTRVIWSVMNSSYRMKMVVPIGSKSPQKAKESLAELMNLYKEDIKFDEESGQVFTNGRPNIQFYKNYLFPSKNGEQIDISTIGGDGPDLSDTKPIQYFYDKFKRDSKVPFSRFDREQFGGVYQNELTVNNEEVSYGKFLNRLRSIYQEILVKPVYIQMTLDFPNLKDDELFKSKVGVRFNKDYDFESLKQMEELKKNVEVIKGLRELTIAENKPYLSLKFLIEKYSGLTNADIMLNEKYMKEENEKIVAAGGTPNTGGGSSGGGGGGGGAPAGGGGGGGETPAPEGGETPAPEGGEAAPEGGEGEAAAPEGEAPAEEEGFSL
jgi:hypothetical protein